MQQPFACAVPLPGDLCVKAMLVCLYSMNNNEPRVLTECKLLMWLVYHFQRIMS